MSTREIIDELDRLAPAELLEIQRRIEDLSRATDTTHPPGLQLTESDGRRVLSGSQTIRQSEVETILADFP
jgi:hypothetical protein